MRKILTLTLLLVSLQLSSLTGEIAYLEGTVDIQRPGSEMEWADIGMTVNRGDSIITGLDGYCEISLEGQSSITIDSDTVFQYGQGATSTAPEAPQENIFRVVMGQIKFKFGQLTGREPAIATTSTVCGIRGTEFTVISSPDGQSLYVVSEGEVAVESQGELVSLVQDEGVEIRQDGLGEKFPVLSGSLDYSQWLADAEESALANPVETLGVMKLQLIDFLDQAEFYYDLWEDSIADIETMAQQIQELREQGDSALADAIVENEFLPLKQQSVVFAVNNRYYALSAESLRQFGLSFIYVNERIKGWQGDMDSLFLSEYESFLEIYEVRAVPFFVPADI